MEMWKFFLAFSSSLTIFFRKKRNVMNTMWCFRLVLLEIKKGKNDTFSIWFMSKLKIFDTENAWRMSNECRDGSQELIEHFFFCLPFIAILNNFKLPLDIVTFWRSGNCSGFPHTKRNFISWWKQNKCEMWKIFFYLFETHKSATTNNIISCQQNNRKTSNKTKMNPKKIFFVYNFNTFLQVKFHHFSASFWCCLSIKCMKIYAR